MGWIWLIAAFYAGIVVGYLIAALMGAANRADECGECEKLLRDELLKIEENRGRKCISR